MRPSRAPGTSVAALILATAVPLLGLRPFLPAEASGCAPAGASCCCCRDAESAPAADAAEGCGCSVSPAVPVPVANVASVDALPPVAAAVVVTGLLPPRIATGRPSRGPTPRSRSAPTQALLETFRN